MRAAWRTTMCVMILTFLPEISVYNFKNNVNLRPNVVARRIQDTVPYITDEQLQYVRHIHSMVNAYSNRGYRGSRLVIETNSLIDTKYRAWKRNADLINSLLALPTGMNDAGR